MRQAQINVRTRACSRTSIARTKQAALTHNVRGKELILIYCLILQVQPQSCGITRSQGVVLPRITVETGAGLAVGGSGAVRVIGGRGEV